MKKIGFIGMGSMARAIVNGLVKKNACDAGDLYAYAPHYDKLKAFADQTGIHACRSLAEMMDQVDTVLMAVKPYVVEGVLAQIRPALKGKALLSVAAGYTFERYRPLVDADTRVQYIMPNTPCMVGEGVLLFEEDTSLTAEELEEMLKQEEDAIEAEGEDE